MRRRDFIILLAGASGWPSAMRAQQKAPLAALNRDQPHVRSATRPGAHLALGATRFRLAGSQADAVPIPPR